MGFPLELELRILMRTCSWWFRNPAKPRFLRRKSTRSFYLSLFSNLIWPAGSRVCVFLYSSTCNLVEHDNRRFISPWWRAFEKFLLSLIFLSRYFLVFFFTFNDNLTPRKQTVIIFSTFQFEQMSTESELCLHPSFSHLVENCHRDKFRVLDSWLRFIYALFPSDSVTWYPIPT